MSKRGKTYLEAKQKLDREREYSPREAISLVKDLKRAKFDESVEVHIRTGLNVRHADEQLRGTIALPNGLGKEVKVAVFAKGDKAREAEEAGPHPVGAHQLAKRGGGQGVQGRPTPALRVLGGAARAGGAAGGVLVCPQLPPRRPGPAGTRTRI